MQFSQILLLMKQWFSQMLLHYSWILTNAVAARAASLKLTHFFLGIPWLNGQSLWPFRILFTELESLGPSTPAPRSRCPSSWANPRCSIPFCWPTSEGRIARRLNWGSVSETNDLRPFKLLECSICVFFLAETILKPKDRLSYISWIKKETKFCFPTSRIMMVTDIFMFGRFSEVHPLKKTNA